MAARPLAGLAVCAGVGGLELGVRLALGPWYRTVGYVERDAYAAATLVARMADQALDPAPVWDDVETFDGRAWRGRVDLVTAGFPCQPFSAAGHRRGTDDRRWLWPHIARIVGEVAPALVYAENVPPLAGRGLDHVLRDLADLGFDAEWSCLSAAALGATHRRERLWLLAYRDGGRLPFFGWQPAGDEAPRHDADRCGGPAVADAGGQGLRTQPRSCTGGEGADGRRATTPGHEPQCAGEGLAHPEGDAERTGLRQDDARSSTRSVGITESPDHHGDLADPTGPGREGILHRTPSGRQGPARPGDGLALWPPGPDDGEAWAAIADAGGPQPGVRRMVDGLAHRVDRLHAIGNGVVPIVAAYALLGLARRAGILDDLNPITARDPASEQGSYPDALSEDAEGGQSGYQDTCTDDAGAQDSLGRRA